MAKTQFRMRVKRVSLPPGNLLDPSSPVYKATEAAAQRAVEIAKQEAPKGRSGRLEDSIEYRIVKTPTRVIADIGPGLGSYGVGTPPAEYAKYVIFGTKGPIKSTTDKKKMKLFVAGGPLFRMYVAGQDPNPFLQRALNKVRAEDWQS